MMVFKTRKSQYKLAGFYCHTCHNEPTRFGEANGPMVCPACKGTDCEMKWNRETTTHTHELPLEPYVKPAPKPPFNDNTGA